MANDTTVTELPIVRVDPQDAEAMTAWAGAATTAFLQDRPTPESVGERQRRLADHRLFAALDGPRTVATFRSFDCDLTLPGREEPLPVNAISSVTVLPTHRRRRLLTRWMTGELARAAGDGVAASILIASEAPIYRRFGFGAATTACTWTVDAVRARWRLPRSGSVEIVDGETFAAAAPAVYAAARRLHPGTIHRTDLRWRMSAQLEPGPFPEDRKVRFAVHRDATGQVDGLLAYKPEEKETDRVSEATLEVRDLVAATGSAYADLWRYCAEVDFVTKVVAHDRSPREPLPRLLTDPRTARDGAVSDFLWARIHDVPAAFSARRYGASGRLVLDVTDPLDQVTGRYALEVDDDGTGTCRPLGTTDGGDGTGDGTADVTLDASALAELWLGSGDVAPLAEAGHLAARDDAALRRTHAMLTWPQPAWCGTWF